MFDGLFSVVAVPGSRTAAIVHVTGSAAAVVLFQLAGRSGEHGDPFLLLYGMTPLAILGCMMGVSRLWSALPHGLELITAVLWVLSINAFALSQRVWEVAWESSDATPIWGQVVLFWSTATAMLASCVRAIWSGSGPRLSRYLEAGAFGVLGLYLLRAGSSLWASLVMTQLDLAAILSEANLRAYVAYAGTVAFGLAAATGWFFGRRNA